MKRRALRILVLLWLGWYISGPVCEAIDSWDPPREEMHDVARSAGGVATLLASIFCLAILLFRKWCERYLFPARSVCGGLKPLTFQLLSFGGVGRPASFHSPPLSPLRV
jgi:hypothetical protein